MYRIPVIFQHIPELVVAESTRHGGVSPAPYASLNLGKSTGDAPENVAENRRRCCAALGFAPEQLAWSKQVHGDAVYLATGPGGAEGFDALITATPGVMVAVSVADCAPILVCDRRRRAVAAIHAGWRGAVAQIVRKTLEAMAERFGTQAADCFAYVGTCIDACSFEVGPEVAAAFDAPFVRQEPGSGQYFADLKQACAAQLLDFGVPAAQIEISPYCTVLHNADYFSHRKEKGVTGRMMALIGFKKEN